MKEIWKDIPGYDGIYLISNLGNVKSLKYNKERILKSSCNKSGYLGLNLYKNNKPKAKEIHRLLMEVFKSDSYIEGYEVNHINGIKTDNKLENLEWVSHKYNTQHAFDIGLNIGFKNENNPNSKLNQKIVNIIRRAYKFKYFNQVELSRLFNVSQANISEIILNKIWN